MKKLAFIIIALFTTTFVNANTYYTLATWKSNQSVNGKFSTTSGGSSCNCSPNFSTDTVYVSNNITLYNGVTITSGALIIENGGRVTLGDWGGSTDFGANAFVEIKDGGTLNNYYTMTNAGQFIVDGTFDMKNGSSITNSGTVEIGSTGTFKVNDYTTIDNSGTFNTTNGSSVTIYTITNSGSMYLDSDINAKDWNTITNSGSFTVGPNADLTYGNITNNSNSTITVYGELTNKKSWNTITNNGTLTVYGDIDAGTLNNNNVVNGTGIVDYNTAGNNNGSINGCSTCSFTSPTYLANVPNSNYKIYKEGNWITGTPTSALDALFLSDYSENVNITANNIVVNPNVTLDIKNNKTLSVSGGIQNNGIIVIEKSANLIQSSSASNTGSGLYIVKQQGTAVATELNKWSSPVPNAKIATVFDDDNLNYIYAFDAATQTYKYDFTGSETNSNSNSPYSFNSSTQISGADGYFDVGRGYFIAGTPNIHSFVDSDVNNGDIYTTVYTSNVTTPSSWGGNDWNMLGNPYPSSISTEEFLDVNYNNGNGTIANAIYYWDADAQQYIVKNNTDNTDLIGKCQGFWVSATSNGQVLYTNSMRSSTNQDLRSSNDHLEGIYIQLTAPSSLEDDIRVYIDERADDNEDNVFDALKSPNGSGFNFYSDINGVNYSFQSIDTLEVNQTKTIAVGFTAHETGMYLFEVDSLLNTDNYSIFIEDLENDNLVDLKTKGNYYVQVDTTGTYNNRFLLHITRNEADTTATTDSTDVVNSVEQVKNRELDATVYQNSADELVVKFNMENDTYTTAYVYDINGRMVENQKLETGSTQSSFSSSNLNTGVYIIQLVSTDGQTKAIKFMNN